MKRSIILALALAARAAAAQDIDQLVVGLGPYGVELNPYMAIYSHEMQVLDALYEGLFAYDPRTMDPVRAGAESWKKSADGRTWTFTLRSDARWSDGSPVTARDYVESWRWLLSPDTGASYAVFLDIVKGARDYRLGKNKRPDSVAVRALDDRTLVVELASPAAYFTRLLCHMSFVPVHASLRGRKVWDPDAVVGNGPYVLESMDDRELVLRKNDGYWDSGSVAIPGVRVLFLDSEAEATARYNDGEIHWLMDMVDTDALLATSDIQYAPSFGTGYYLWDSGTGPWNDARVRRALALLLPWERIRSEDTYYAPTSTLILPFSGYQSPAGIDSAQPDEAQKLLAEAGYADPSTLPTVRMVVPDTDSHDANARLMADAWAEYGIASEIVHPEEDLPIRDLRKSGFSLSFTSWIGDFADPAAFLLMWTSDSSLNESRYSNPEYDALLRRSMSEEGAARMATMAKAEALLLSEAAVLPVYHTLSFDVVDTEAVLGWFLNPMDIHPFKALSFGTPKARANVAALEVRP